MSRLELIRAAAANMEASSFRIEQFRDGSSRRLQTTECSNYLVNAGYVSVKT